MSKKRIVIDWDIGGFVFFVLTPIVVSVYVAFRLAAYNDGALTEVGPTVESKGYPVLFGAFAAFAVTGLLMVGINWVWRQIVGLIKGEPPTEPDELEDLGLTEEEDPWISLDTIDETQPMPRELPTEPDEPEDLGLTEEEDPWISLDSIDETQPSPEEIAAQVDRETLEQFERQFSGEEPVRERTPRPHYPSGLSKHEIWSQVAERVGGDLMRSGGWHNHWIKYRYREWDIVLERRSSWFREVQVTWTRMYAAFNNKHGLRFKIKYKGIVPAIETMLGAQDIETGDGYFDQIFITQGNNEGKIKELLNDEKLRKLIPRRSGMYFEIRNNEGWLGPKYPKGVDLLFFECNEIKSGPALESLFELFTGTLERMVEIGSASADAPNIKR